MENTPIAAFSIIDYCFDKVLIDITNRSGDDISLSFSTNGCFFAKESTYELTFGFIATSGDNKEPFVNIQCRGSFKFNEAVTFETIPAFFYNNSVAILYPYLRAYVSLITTQANTKGIILPTLNLSSLGEELKKNTTQK